MDYRLFRVLNGLADGRLDGLTVFFVDAGAAIVVVILAWLWFVTASRAEPFRRLSTRVAVARALVASAVALAVGQVIVRVAPRPRPFEVHPVHLLVAHAPDPSFPSDHALAAFAIATAIVVSHRRAGMILYLVGGVLGLARVIAGVHYPGDVIGGAVLGAMVGIVVRWSDPLITPLVQYGSRWTDSVTSARRRMWPYTSRERDD